MKRLNHTIFLSFFLMCSFLHTAPLINSVSDLNENFWANLIYVLVAPDGVERKPWIWDGVLGLNCWDGVLGLDGWVGVLSLNGWDGALGLSGWDGVLGLVGWDVVLSIGGCEAVVSGCELLGAE